MKISLGVKCPWVLNLRQHFREQRLKMQLVQHRHPTVKAEIGFLELICTSGRITVSTDGQDTHSYLCIYQRLSLTAVKCLSLFII